MKKLPVVFAPHGGGPWPFVDMGLDRAEVDQLTTYLRSVQRVPSEKPKALLIVSAHWEESVPTVMTSAKPPILYDYYGFPPASYEIEWPAPGDPKLAARVRELLAANGFETKADDKRGFDHGAFVPFKVTYPEADIPTIQLSLASSLDPKEHIAIGRAIAPLREEGVFILGSGMSFHNMRAFRNPAARQLSSAFDEWLENAATAEPEERDRLLSAWADAPGARVSHPREEHLLPLMVIAGAAGADRGTRAFEGSFGGAKLGAFHFG